MITCSPNSNPKSDTISDQGGWAIKNGRFSQEQIIAVLKQMKAGRTAVELGREIGESNHAHLPGKALAPGPSLVLLNIETPGIWYHPVGEKRGQVKP